MRRVGVAGDEVHEPGPGQLRDPATRIGLERERRGRLDERTRDHEVLEVAVEAGAEMPLGVRHDRPRAEAGEVLGRLQQRSRQRSRCRLEQHPAPRPAERDLPQLARIEVAGGRLGELAAGGHPDRDRLGGEGVAERAHPPGELADAHVVVVADVRCGAHDRDPVRGGLARHRERVGQIDGPVVDLREDVAVQIDEAGLHTTTVREPGAAAVPLVLDDAGAVGRLAAELVANRLRSRPGIRLALPTGRTPLGMYAALRAHAAGGGLPVAQATLFQLDEYAGLGPTHPQSFAAALTRETGPMRFGAVRLLDGAADDLEGEGARYQRLLEEAPLDLVVLGIGRDGHVAFDEPGSPQRGGVRVTALAETTRADAAAAFGGIAAVPGAALTMGLETMRRARSILLLATGAEKARALHAMLEGPVTPSVPASLLRDHPRLTVLCDRPAAGALTPAPSWGSDHALVVLGHRDPGVSPEHRISAESLARLRRGADIARTRAVRLAVLTGWTTTRHGLSEAEQMLAAWGRHETPALLEVAGRNTAENASRSLPLLLASGCIGRVTVVTSAWHVRTPYFFAPYRREGLELDFARSFRPFARWPSLLAREAREARLAPDERRAALAAMRLPAGGGGP